MKIAEVITDSNIGGAGVLLANRLHNTDPEIYQTTVLLPRGSALIERLKGLKINIIEMDCCFDASFEFFSIFKYVGVLRALHPDIINCHGALSARIAAKLCRVPVKLCTRHCVFPIKSRNALITRLSGYINSALSDSFIAVAEAARKNLLELGIDGSKIRVIINGARRLPTLDHNEKVKLREMLGIANEEAVLVMNARLEPYKGHIWFFEAVRQLIDDGVRIKVLLLGDGSERERLLKLSKGYAIEKYVIFTGFVNDVAPYMNIADININCSTGTETSSLALSEGMSIGLPAVVSDYGGNPYMVRHGVNGFVCRCYDHIAMAKYVKKLIRDKCLYEQISINARERFESELNARAMTQKTNLLYEGLYKTYEEQRVKAVKHVSR